MGCVVLIVMATQISWQLTLLSLLPMPIMALVIKRYGDQLHSRFKAALGGHAQHLEAGAGLAAHACSAAANVSRESFGFKRDFGPLRFAAIGLIGRVLVASG